MTDSKFKKDRRQLFSPNNKKVNHEIEVKMNNVVLPYQHYVKYMGVALDKNPSFKRRLEASAQKLITQIILFQNSVGC